MTDYYLSHGGKLDHPQQFDRALFMDAFSACLLDNAKRSDYEDVLYELKESWMNYMVDKFGIRKISEVVSNPSEFESIIGETFEETREDWKKRIID